MELLALESFPGVGVATTGGSSGGVRASGGIVISSVDSGGLETAGCACEANVLLSCAFGGGSVAAYHQGPNLMT